MVPVFDLLVINDVVHALDVFTGHAAGRDWDLPIKIASGICRRSVGQLGSRTDYSRSGTFVRHGRKKRKIARNRKLLLIRRFMRVIKGGSLLRHQTLTMPLRGRPMFDLPVVRFKMFNDNFMLFVLRQCATHAADQAEPLAKSHHPTEPGRCPEPRPTQLSCLNRCRQGRPVFAAISTSRTEQLHYKWPQTQE